MNLTPSSLATAAANLLLPDAPGTTGGARPAIALAALDRTVDAAAAPAVLAPAKAGTAKPKAAAARARRTSTGYAKPKASALSPKKASTGKTTTKTPSKTTTKATTAKATTPKAAGDLAFLNDPKLSIEEKLFRFMKYFATKYEQQLEAKLKEVGGKTSTSKAATKTTTKAPAKKKSGLAKFLSSPSVKRLAKQLSGPVLSAAATAVGLPALAPILMKAGPDVVTALGGLADLVGGGGSATASAASDTTAAAASSGSTSPAGTEELSKADALEIERLQEKQKEMFSLVSNVLRGMHDTKMAVINNVRS